ncbi:membrane protein [Roseibium aquae]|uniref:Membrane protein n=1 Tax=Roseibium aquae TaxID=1323746 RepID=A0A916WW34_9HYPH|nr:membrane protein [Roseibium aquae]
MATVSALAISAPSFAQDAGLQTVAEPQRQYDIDIGLGAVMQPRYAASDSYILTPFPIINVGRFFVPGLGQVADGRKRQGVFFFPSFGFVGERSASDDRDLTGTRDVDWALELGLGAGYRTENWRVFGELRQGINGHTGQVGQLGFDAIFYPTDRIEFSAGPRAGFAFGDYMDTYFGVTAAEAAASGGRLAQYDPDSGFTSLGLSARASYDLTDRARFHLQGGYDRLIGDAADSPIAKVGDENQFFIGAGVSYRFSFDLFR